MNRSSKRYFVRSGEKVRGRMVAQQDERRDELLSVAFIYIRVRLVQTGIVRAKHSYATEPKKA